MNRGANGAFYTIAATTTVGDRITVKEMEKLYKGTFSRKNSPARHLYDKIKTASGICPLCAQGKVDTLDHYLAQSLHPALAVTPMNLVPACFSCNKAKLDSGVVKFRLSQMVNFRLTLRSVSLLIPCAQPDQVIGQAKARRATFVMKPSQQ